MWYIMSYNNIHGLSNGAFTDLDHLFYAGRQTCSDNCRWVPLVSEAMPFESMQDAKSHAERIWGPNFPRDGFMYAFFEGVNESRDEVARASLNRRREFERGLAAQTLTRDMLLEMRKTPTDSGMKFAEAWLIEIMEKDRDND